MRTPKAKMSFLLPAIAKPFACLMFLAMSFGLVGAQNSEDGDWISLFDGKTLEGWKANENGETWSVRDGAIVAKGPVSHLFYVGKDSENPKEFGDFELKLEVMTAAENTNSGVFFRCPWKDSGWLQKTFEAQIQNSGKNKCYTGGLWIHADRAEESPVEDDEWFDMHIIARGEKITVSIDGKTTTEYDASKDNRKWAKVGSKGLVALQGHGQKHRPHFRNIRIKKIAKESEAKDGKDD